LSSHQKLRFHLIRLFTHCLLVALLFVASLGHSEELKLPNLGESSTSLFSPEQEYKLGRAWLRMFRSQAPTLEDPIVHDYLESLLYTLVTHSELQDRRIELVVVDNPVLNAFAVPGGVIGVHTGLLLYAQSEDELATVLAHEIAHLSQRHFSRGVEAQKKQQPITLAGMLAGLVLIATTGGSAGLAALSASQAAALESQMRFSRSNEQEADRIGMQTMVEAGMDPHAAPSMFERMLAATRYSGGSRTPEFLRTHPLSESRISDTRNRAREYPKTIRPESLDFHLVRARIQVHHAESPQRAVSEFRGMLEGKPRSREAARYGLVLALKEAGQPAEARRELDILLLHNPTKLEYIIAGAEIDMDIGEAQASIRALTQELQLYPGNHALTMAYARALLQDDQPHIAEQVLLEQSRRRPNDAGMWYLLAEVSGLSGNILGVHRARAEYFILNGILDEAERQLNYALRLAQGDYHTSALVNQRIQDVNNLRRRMDL
jgi:predicted Zn-dependent protease